MNARQNFATAALPCVSDLTDFAPRHHPEDDERISSQPLGAARVDVVYDTCFDRVIAQGAYINGELVDTLEFSKSTVRSWERAIEKELQS
jgi:hypothetical protein